MSFINGLLDFTVSISYQPSCTVTHKGSRSHVYEINAWLWNFGRPQPRVGGLSVAKTERIRRMSESKSEAARRAWKTKNARKQRAEEEKSSSDSSSD
jgi:hypothetical protein